MLRIKNAFRRLLTATRQLLHHTQEPYPSLSDRAFLCSTAPMSAAAVRDEYRDR